MTDSNQYWRSLDELEGNGAFQEFVDREFPEATFSQDGMGRRRFIQLMGASFALAVGTTGCRWEKEKILPHTRRPETHVPGKFQAYNTAMELGGAAIGLRVTASDGRPIKIEGNPDHPFSAGGTDTYAQASILAFYDPDRSTQYLQASTGGRAPSSRPAFIQALRGLQKAAAGNGGAKLRILSGPTTSPTIARLRADLAAAMPRAKWVETSTLSRDSEAAGLQATFGQRLRAHPHVGKADVLLTLDADLFNHHPSGMRAARDWGQRRRVEEGEMIRHYAVESVLTATGSAADHRLALRAGHVGLFAQALAAAVAQRAKAAGPKAPAGGLLDEPRIKTHLAAIADDLVAHRGKVLVVAGQRQPADVHALAHWINATLGSIGTTVTYSADDSPERPDHQKALADLTKEMAGGAVDTLIILEENPVYTAPGDVDFAGALAKVQNTVHVGLYEDETGAMCNWHCPATHFLASWGDARTADGTITIRQPVMKPLYNGVSAAEVLAELAGKPDQDPSELVRETFVTTFGPEKDAPAEPAAPAPAEGSGGAGGAAAALAAGGAAATAAGDAAAAQGGTAPAGTGGAAAAQGGGGAAAAGMGGGGGTAPIPVAKKDDAPAPTNDGDPELEKYHPRLSSVDVAWQTAVHDGFVKDSAYESVVPTANVPKTSIPATAPAGGVANGDLEVVFYDDGKVHDGRYANNAWMQELPELRTKLTWDNALIVSPQTAQKLGLEDEVLATVQVGSGTVQVPVVICPGQPTGSLGVAIGYGRTRAGLVGGLTDSQVNVGFDVRPLRTVAAPYIAAKATVKSTGTKYELANTVNHWNIDEGGKKERERRAHKLIREVPNEEYAQDPDVIHHMDHHPPLVSLFDDLKYTSYQWGLNVDLNRCTGCNACVIACTSENNVPVVGKEQVIKSREMYWLRIDRYWKGTEPETATTVQQPMLCQQCENAPCEQVCPVAATVHTNEGLNSMTYNRCIGTRYCSNNCPYKVRRFNFHNYNEDLKDPRNKVKLMVMNPEVTVRHRGVMEKCTYCAQRIAAAKTEAKVEGRPVKDGDITPACAQACPTEAIVFGDLRDPEARITKLHGLKRTYAILEELNNRPRTRYMARITNPNPALKA